LKFSSCEIAH